MFAAFLLALAVPGDAGLFDPVTGYRIASYRGVIREAPPGVRRFSDVDAARAHERGEVLFVDVTPADGAVRDPASGAWRLAEPHDTIPGAHWFPEAGRGPANPVVDQWFVDGLKRLTHGSRRRPIVAFCLADCWMSWNASWKIRRLGYRDVGWYANGIDGWRDMGRTEIAKKPER